MEPMQKGYQTQSGSVAINAANFWDDRFTFSDSLVDTELNLPPWNHTSTEILTDSEVYSIDPSVRSFKNPRRSKATSHEKVTETVEDIFSPFEMKRTGSSSQVSQYDHGKAFQSLEVDNMAAIQEGFITTSWPRGKETFSVSSDHWKDCSVYPLSNGSTSTKDIGTHVRQKARKEKVGVSDSRVVIKKQEDELATTPYLGKSHSGYENKNPSSLAFSLAPDCAREDLPRLPHVKIKSG